MNVSEAVLSRRSIRAFLDRPVDEQVLRRVFDRARWAPSGCNFQPWEATLLTGAPLGALQERIAAARPQDPPEYSWSDPEVLPEFVARKRSVGMTMLEARGVARHDMEGRNAVQALNRVSFGAPALLLVYFPRVMGPPQWADVGMWLQSVMLLLREEGLDSCPQIFLSIYAKQIKDFLGVSDETHIFFTGLAIGYRDPDAPVNNFVREREEVHSKVHFAGF